jgi:hypothetical protein
MKDRIWPPVGKREFGDFPEYINLMLLGYLAFIVFFGCACIDKSIANSLV